MVIAFVENVVLESMACGKCGIVFAMPQDKFAELRQYGGTWYCPNGCPRCFRESDVKRLERELAQERQRRDQSDAKAREAKAAADRLSASLGKEVKAHARTKTRTAKGVCPCCTRSFTNLYRHMTTKHPDFATGKGA